jgi:hypothetical protein
MSDARTVIATFSGGAEATQLVFVGQPGAVQVGTVLTPPVQVAVQDAAGQTVTDRTDAITLQIGTNPGGATLGGQVTRNAQNGVATFTDLTLDKSGDSYTLVASSPGLTNATSTGFNVSAEPVAQLAFSVQPSTAQAGASISPAVKVEIRDPQGAVLTARTDQITVALQNNPGGGPLGGSQTVTAIAGVATFSNLTLQKAATGYTLAASTPNASGATSSAFNITAGPPKLITRNSVETQSAPVSTNVSVRPSVLVVDAFNNPVEGVAVTWTVTAGNGSVVASTTDPVVRATGPLGLSTAVSWTLGPDVGTNNNELQATVSTAGITGSPITFKASGTIPPGQGVFTGTLKKITNAGFIPPEVRIASATLKFLNANTDDDLGTATSRNDGTFTSPPLPGGIPYKINISNPDFKSISYAKPALTAGTTFSLGDLGMVPFSDDEGTAGIRFMVELSDTPSSSIIVHYEVFRGYYVGAADNEFLENSDNVDTDVETGTADVVIDPLGDWGLLTVRVSADGYEPQDRFIAVDGPTDFIGPCGIVPEGLACIEPFELQRIQ